MYAAAGCDSLTVNILDSVLRIVAVAVGWSPTDNSRAVLMQFQPKEVAF
jgi:hypothetical protein